MIDPKVAKAVSKAQEHESKRVYESYGFKVEPLDREGRNTRKRVEFLIVCCGAPLLLHEDKAVQSGGTVAPGGPSASMLDPTLLDHGSFEIDPSKATERVYDRLAEARGQYRETVEDLERYRGLPLIVRIHLDFFASSDYFIEPRRLTSHPEVSGLVVVERNRALLRELAKEPPARQRERFNADDWSGLPARTSEFRLLSNPSPKVEVPRLFRACCLPWDADSR